MRVRSAGRGAAILTAAGMLAAALSSSLLPVAAGEPGANATGQGAAVVSADGSRIVDSHGDGRYLTLTVFSAAMNAEFTVHVQRAADTSAPRPVLYLLSGGSGGKGPGSWDQQTRAGEFLARKDVHVVQPIGGAASYYTDWRSPDPKLGTVKWKTYLTEELPPLIDAALHTSGVNAIAGVSMSGTSVLQLAIAKPGLYRAVAAYSGCAQIADPIGQAYVRLTVAYSGGDAGNMYGPPGDPVWAANDPYLNAAGLRGVELFLSSGNGIPGPYDRTGDHRLAGGGAVALANQVLVGGIIEAATEQCTRVMADRLADLGIPATVVLRDYGTHSWGYWEDELAESWPVLARGLGL